MVRKPRQPAWIPPEYDLQDIYAIKALHKGEADASQQARALDWIIKNAAASNELSFRSDQDGGERETAFAEGRKFVGMQILKMINLPPKLVAEMRNKND
jgi:hypothetical protein